MHGAAQLTATVFVFGSATGRVRGAGVSICGVRKMPDDRGLFSAGSRDKSSTGSEKKKMFVYVIATTEKERRRRSARSEMA